MAVFTFEWCRVEGSPIPDLQKEYGTFTQLPSNTKIFYGTPEIQINNPTSIVNGVVYKVVPVSEFGYDTILDIDDEYDKLLSAISSYDKTVDISDATNSAQYYYEPFVVEETSVIFHADSTKKSFDHYAIVYVDKYATPEIITVVGNYKGPAIPVGETFNLDDIELFAVYADGNQAQIKQGYTVEPEDRIITQLKSNVIKITYTSPTGTTFVSSLVIQGIKNLQGIEAMYDGPSVGYGNEAAKKYFVVVAQYSDGSSAVVTDFTFPSGNIVSENNGGVITIYYKGFYTTVIVPTFDVSSSRLIAYYNGPNVEVGHNFDTKYCNIKIYYRSDDEINTYYEDIDPELCTFSTTTVDHEGVNHVTVQYTGKCGPVSTTLIVIGITPEVTLNFIEAEYTGSPIVVGKAFSIERVICKAHYSNGSIVQVRNFAINSNIVQFVGLNEYTATYKEKDITVTTVFSVTGLEKDDTTTTGYSPIYLENRYPEATRMNHRYRGPAEAYKNDSVHQMLVENIRTLYEFYASIEQTFNKLVETVEGNNCIKVRTLNTVSQLEAETASWLTDKRFTTGKYQVEKEESHEQ